MAFSWLYEQIHKVRREVLGPFSGANKEGNAKAMQCAGTKQD